MKHLLLFDYDGTIADSFSDSPNGVNVHIAYEKAVEEIYGANGLVLYRERLGGLQNRSPHELVVALMNELGESPLSLLQQIEDLVQKKLNHLVPEISEEWPVFYPGVKEFFQAANEGSLPVDLGIISSGHNEFIAQSFKVNDIPVPDILITSDIGRTRRMPGREWYKPHTYQLAQGHKQWIKGQEAHNGRDYHMLGGAELFSGRGELLGKAHMAYVGDDPIKDGGLAKRSRIPFIHVPFTNGAFVPDNDEGQIQVGDFSELHNLLKGAENQFRAGKPFSEILLNRPDAELFRRQPEGQLYDKILAEKAGGSVMSRR